MTGPSISYRRLVREHRDFRRLWLGEVVSFFGDWFNTIALYAAVQAVTSSGQAIAAVWIVKTLPIFFISPFAGPIIDRFDRRKILLTTDFARALGVIGLIIAHQQGSLVGIYTITTIMTLFAGLVLPTKSSVMPMVLPPRHLSVANALSGGTWSMMLAFGAAVGGLVTSWLGITASFMIDGLTFLISASFFWRLPTLRPPAATQSKQQTSFVEGLRYLRRTPYVLGLILLKPLMAISSGIFTLLPLYGKEVFAEARGDDYTGYLLAVRGLGAAVGSLLIRLIVGDSPKTLRRMILPGYLLMGSAYLWISYSNVYAEALLGFFFGAVGASMVWVYGGTLIQWEGSRQHHGRLFAIEWGGHTLLLAVCNFAAGFALDHGYTIPQVAFYCACLAFLPAIFWAVVLYMTRHRPLPKLTYTPPPPEEPIEEPTEEVLS